MNERERNQNQAGSEIKTFSVPFAVGEIKENIIINTTNRSELSKEQIILQAFKFHSQGNIQEAAKYYQLSINQGFEDHRVFSNYGVILKDLGKLEEAEISQRKAIELKPDFANSYLNLGIIYRELGKPEEAEKSIRKAIELKPDFVQGYSNLGNILKDIGSLKEAELSYRKAIEIKPDFAEAYSNLGLVLKDLGNSEGALKAYSNSIALQSNFSNALMNRAQLFFEKKEYKKALRDADSCNTINSRAFSVEILYSLGRINEIYERIERNSIQDNENIRLAAFSSFISEQENKKTSNNFCQNPLSFLHCSNLKLHLNDYIEFTKEVIKELHGIKLVWEPPQNTTVNGFHTPTNINLFSNPKGKISQLKTIILNELDSYYLKFEKESCSYIQKWPSNKNLKAWHVILKKQGYQKAHIHPAGWLSGVIYLKVVPSLNRNEGAIEFSLNGENYSNKNSSQITHQPELGDIVLFPSSLHHRTIPFSTDTDRIVVAFDLMPMY